MEADRAPEQRDTSEITNALMKTSRLPETPEAGSAAG